MCTNVEGDFGDMVDGFSRFFPVAVAVLSGCRWFYGVAALLLFVPAHLRKSPSLLVGCGYMLERAGLLSAARDHYARALDRTRVSARMSEVRWSQATEFLLERSRAGLGKPRVADPLFETAFLPPKRASRRTTVAGFFAVDSSFAGLKIVGFITKAAGSRISLFIDDDKLKTINTDGSQMYSSFSFTILRPTVYSFPRRGVITVRSDAGEALLSTGFCRGVLVEAPYANGSIARMLTEGAKVSKKGDIVLHDHDRPPAHIDSVFTLYDKLRRFFALNLGKELFCTYGTLLGIFRDNAVIPGDDDFDAGYFSSKSDPRQVKEEALGIIESLVESGFSVILNRRGTPLRIGIGKMDEASLHLDVRPFWYQNGRVWAHTTLMIRAERKDFLPPQEIEFNGHRILLPSNPEVFLREHYGKDWKTPDPGFRYYPSKMSPYRAGNLSLALVSPHEFRLVKRRLETKRISNGDIGSFELLAESRLYPLDDYFVE